MGRTLLNVKDIFFFSETRIRIWSILHYWPGPERTDFVYFFTILYSIDVKKIKIILLIFTVKSASVIVTSEKEKFWNIIFSDKILS